MDSDPEAFFVLSLLSLLSRCLFLREGKGASLMDDEDDDKGVFVADEDEDAGVVEVELEERRG